MATSLSSLKKLAGDSLIYGISGVITRFLSVFLVPLYTRYFTPAEYGVVGLTVNLFALLMIVVILGLDNSVARWYYDTDNNGDRRTSLNTFLWTCFAFALIVSVMVFLLSDWLAILVLGNRENAFILRVAAINLPLSIFAAFTWNLLRMQRRPVATTVFTLATGLLTIGLNLLFVVKMRVGIASIFYAQLITSAVAVAWTFFLFKDEIQFPAIDVRRLREMIGFSLPLIPGSIAFWIVSLSGGYFVRAWRDASEVGLYQIGATVAAGMALVTGAFQMAWGPFAFSIHKESHAKKVYAQTMLGYLALTCSLALLLALFAREILLVFTTEAYASSDLVAGFLAYNYVLIGLTYVASIGAGIAKNNNTIGVSMIVSALVLVGSSTLLVPYFGKEGAAVATLISQSLVPIAVFWHAQRLFPIPYSFGKAFFIFALSFVSAFGTHYFLIWPDAPLFQNVALKLVAFTIYCVVIALIFRKELVRIKEPLLSLLRGRTGAIIK